MGTNGLIAVVEGDDFVGVYQWLDAHPHALGNQLLLDVLDADGDLEACAAKWVHDAPAYGWFGVFGGPREGDGEEPSRWSRANARDVLQHVNYSYLLDIGKRTLSVYGCSDAIWEDEPETVVTLSADGRAEPAFFEGWADPPPACPIAISPLDPETLARCRRLDGLVSIEGSGTREAFYEALVDRLSAALDGLVWRDPIGAVERELRERVGEPVPVPDTEGRSEIRVHAHAWNDEAARSLAVGPHTLLWPVDATLREPFPALMRPDGHRAFLQVDHALDAELAATWASLQVRSENPSIDVEIYDGDDGIEVFRFFEVVGDDGESFDPDRHLRLAEARELDPDCGVGDALGQPYALPAVDLYVLLDQLWWWRQSSRRGRFRLALS